MYTPLGPTYGTIPGPGGDLLVSPDDARRLGYDPGQLTFTSMAQTANGTVMGAPIRIEELVVGPIVMNDVENASAAASAPGMIQLIRWPTCF